MGAVRRALRTLLMVEPLGGAGAACRRFGDRLLREGHGRCDYDAAMEMLDLESTTEVNVHPWGGTVACATPIKPGSQ